jgi:transmembrane sensor
LAPETRLRTSDSAGVRQVFLDGTAYFAVMKVPGVPFRVRTAAGDATVLGTQFEISAEGQNARLVVVEGRVALRAEGEAVEVGANEVSQVSAGVASAAVKVEDARAVVGWLGRFIVFQSTPVPKVAEELTRVYGVDVELTDTTLAAETYTGWFEDREFSDVFAIICRVLQTECTVENGVAKIGG